MEETGNGGKMEGGGGTLAFKGAVLREDSQNSLFVQENLKKDTTFPNTHGGKEHM